MASATTLKSYFETGDVPTQAQFAELIDSTHPNVVIASGTITQRSGAIDFSGGNDGDVLTVQSDGSLAMETPASGGVSDHGALSGLGDDDHTQYMLADGTRAFSGVVVGVTPTASGHLATKGYVDGVVAGLTFLTDSDIDTLAEINAILGDATLIDDSDSRLTNSRDWTADIISQAEAEAGTDTTPRKWTAERVKQAIAALGGSGGGDLVAADINTLAKINAILTDATLIDTGDSRLSDSRTPTSHTHAVSELSDSTASGRSMLTAADAAAQRTLLNVEDGSTADQTDAEIETAYNSRVGIVSQADAEAGTSTTAARWTAERVNQAITALAPASGGGIGGATGATDNAILRADGTGGGTVQSSAITITDTGELQLEYLGKLGNNGVSNVQFFGSTWRFLTNVDCPTSGVNFGTTTGRFLIGYFKKLNASEGTSYLTGADDPTTTDIPAGYGSRWKNTTTGEIRDWVNDGGTMKKSADYT